MKKQIPASLLIGALAAVALVGVIVAPPGSVNAQTPVTPNRDLGALITLTAGVAGTTNSADQYAAYDSAITCVWDQSAHVGSPSSVMTIQGKDGGTGAYYTLIASSAMTNDATPTAVSVGRGLPATSNVSAGLPVPHVWRISITVSSTTSTTAKIGCNEIRGH